MRQQYYMKLVHSAKGSTWEEHKYVKRIDGTYYYPKGYEGGRTIDTLEKQEEDGTAPDYTQEDIEALAMEVIRGNFANGEERKQLLGDIYQKVQDRVNELYKSGKIGNGGSPSKGDGSGTDKKTSPVEAANKALKDREASRSSGNKDGANIYSVYDKQKERLKKNKKSVSHSE